MMLSKFGLLLGCMLVQIGCAVALDRSDSTTSLGGINYPTGYSLTPQGNMVAAKKAQVVKKLMQRDEKALSSEAAANHVAESSMPHIVYTRDQLLALRAKMGSTLPIPAGFRMPAALNGKLVVIPLLADVGARIASAEVMPKPGTALSEG